MRVYVCVREKKRVREKTRQKVKESKVTKINGRETDPVGKVILKRESRGERQRM